MLTPQLVLDKVRGVGRLKLRRPHVSPVIKRLAEHVYRVRGYQPYPDLLAVAADALDAWLSAKSDEEREAERARALLLPPHVTFGGRREVTVGEAVDHFELAAFAVGGGDRLALMLVAAAGAAPQPAGAPARSAAGGAVKHRAATPRRRGAILPLRRDRPDVEFVLADEPDPALERRALAALAALLSPMKQKPAGTR